LLVLPSVADKKITIKTQIRSLIPAQIFYGDPMSDSINLEVVITEKVTGKTVATGECKFSAKRDNLSEMTFEIPFSDFKSWTPDNPFLYIATERLRSGNGYVR